MRIKRLSHEWWMECEEEHRGEETVPRFGKPGLYLVGEDCWFENLKGNAYTHKATYFKHCLNTLHAEQSINNRKLKALYAIINEGLATPKQKALFRFARHARKLIDIRRGAIICRKRLIGK